MRFVLVPRHYVPGKNGSAIELVLWAAVLCENNEEKPAANVLLRVDGVEYPVSWRFTFAQRVFADEVKVLVPGERTNAQLLVDGTPRASAMVSAPPIELPEATERPYTVLVGSCYWEGNDPEALVARTMRVLEREGATPDVKFLCGDQVYVDQPPNYAWSEHPREELEEKFLQTYAKTWSEEGLLPLLRYGATYCTSDDHEFWNEFPVMRGHGGRTKDWETICRELFVFFQRREDPAPFCAGPVSFFALDTRIDRDEQPQRFAPEARMHALEQWLRALQGPGVLVLGETFFGEEGSVGVTVSKFLGNVLSQPTINSTLQEHEQYKALASMLVRSGKTVILLSGDVHWGRIAECSFPNGTRLIEVVSSPMTLVDAGMSRLGRPWTKAPSPFSADGISAEVHTVGALEETPYRVEHNHFCTLEFTRSAQGKGVQFAVRHWRIGDGEPGGERVYETLL